jgi:hypothetical protein
LPEGCRKRRGKAEVYETARYLTVTGHRVDGAPAEIARPDPSTLAGVLRRLGLLDEPGAAPPPPNGAPGSSWRGRAYSSDPADWPDELLIGKASAARNGAKFTALWGGDFSSYQSQSEADLALCCLLAFWTQDGARLDRLFRAGGLMREKWDEKRGETTYGAQTIRAALDTVTEGDGGGTSGGSESFTRRGPPPTWPDPIPFTSLPAVPAFPVDVLPGLLREWVEAVAEATQTPADLAALLALPVCGASLAIRFRVVIRAGWTEPMNLFTAVALPPGERKSAVFTLATAPVRAAEDRRRQETAAARAEAAAERRVLEAALKSAEGKAAREEGAAAKWLNEVKRLARDLAGHCVPEAEQLWCEDITPEKVAGLLALHNGRMLQCSAEGTPFEIVKGRYSDKANPDVYLKGHAGDPLRVNRVGRDVETVEQPALSLALAVQPDVIRGLAEDATLARRGFLARFLYSLPPSRVGSREVAPPAVPPTVQAGYDRLISAFWWLPGRTGQDGRPAPHWLRFSPDADLILRELEGWLEPQLADGEVLAPLAGWAHKLAGACARLAGILHMAERVGAEQEWDVPVGSVTVGAAVRLGRDYLLPHAQAAFAVMGADERHEKARRLWDAIRRNVGSVSVVSGDAPLRVSRRQLHRWGARMFVRASDLDEPIAALVDLYYLRGVEGSGTPGRGHKSPDYEVNPKALARRGDPVDTADTADT